MTAIKFTLITVTYNAEATIGRTLQSVAQQTYPHVEHLIIDGASTDGTVEKAQKFPHARVTSEPDKGLYDAMNKGLRIATGDYLCFLNAGDTLHSPDTLAHIAQAVQAHIALSDQARAPLASDGLPVGILYGDTHIVDAQGRFLRNRRLTPPEHLTWRSFRHGMLVCHQAFYIHRRLIRPYDLTYRFSADFDWCIRCLQESERCGMHTLYIKEPLADYLAEGMTTANHKASLRERFRIMAHHYGLLPTLLQHLWFVLRTITLK